jgi:hypothetical protein
MLTCPNVESVEWLYLNLPRRQMVTSLAKSRLTSHVHFIYREPI